MECKDIRDKLSPYLEGALLPEEKKAVEGHLPSCPPCRAALEDLKKTGELVRSLEEVEPPAGMTQKIMSRVRAEEERKRGLWRRLFYPLHIKVPIEAVATIFIAVIAVYVFRAVEPEMKRAHLPVSPGPVVTQEKESIPTPESKAPSQPSPDKNVLKEQARKQRAAAAPAPPPAAVEAPAKEEKAPEAPAPAKKKEAFAGRAEEQTSSADALKRLELGEARPPAPQAAHPLRESAPAPPAEKDLRERKGMAAAPKSMMSAPVKPGPSEITVKAENVKAALGEVENLLAQLGARKMEAESRDGKEVLTAELETQNLKAFLERLTAIGEVEEKGAARDTSEGSVTLRIEIVPQP